MGTVRRHGVLESEHAAYTHTARRTVECGACRCRFSPAQSLSILLHAFLGTLSSSECRSTGLYGAIKADSGLRSLATYSYRALRKRNTIATKGAQQWRKTVAVPVTKASPLLKAPLGRLTWSTWRQPAQNEVLSAQSEKKLIAFDLTNSRSELNREPNGKLQLRSRPKRAGTLVSIPLRRSIDPLRIN